MFVSQTILYICISNHMYLITYVKLNDEWINKLRYLRPYRTRQD